MNGIGGFNLFGNLLSMGPGMAPMAAGGAQDALMQARKKKMWADIFAQIGANSQGGNGPLPIQPMSSYPMMHPFQQGRW